MKNRLMSVLLCLCMTATLLSAVQISAAAADTISYVDKDGKLQSIPIASATQVTSDTTTWNGDWYYVSGNVSGSVSLSGVTVSGDVHLILADDADLEVTSSENAAGINVEGSNSLTIYGQAGGSGKLTATGDGGAGIGGKGDGGTITINGGTVTATSNYGAGIGGGNGGNGGNITINGGTVTATSNYGAGIGGGGNGGNGGNITINGGTVMATGSTGAGIGGGGNGGNGGNISISGGTVTATCNYDAGIGGGNGGGGGNITINGGTVMATGSSGAGIGGGYPGDGGSIAISGGTVMASSTYGAGIGGGVRGGGGTVFISGGSVKASGGGSAQDIGNGDDESGSFTPQNNSTDKTPVYLTAITLNGISVKTAVTSLTTKSYNYGINDTDTDDTGKLYLYLPEKTKTTAASTASMHYAGLVTASNSSTSGTLYEVPKITSVTIPEGNYKAETSLDFTVHFSTSVMVDSSGGTPYLPLTVGSKPVQAVYQSGSGTNELLFRYTVQSGDNDTDGIAVGDKITLNGGTIRNTDADTESALTNISDTSKVLVDTTAPIVSGITPAENATAVSASGNVVITFSEPMDASAGAASLTPSGGRFISLTGGAWSSGGTVYTVPYTALDYSTSYTLAVSGFSDTAGNVMSAYSRSFTTELEPLEPSVSPESLIIYKDDTARFSVALGQGTAAASSAAITVTDGTIASTDTPQLTGNGTVTVSGLAVGTTNITIAFSNNITKTLSVTVEPAPPAWPKESRLTASGVTQTGAVLTWTAASDISAVTGYRIYQNGALIKTVDGATLTYSVTGLSASTGYSFQVQAGNANGSWTTVGPIVSVTTSAFASEGSSTTASITGANGTSGTVSITTSGGTASAEIGSAQGNALAGGSTLELAIPTVKDAVSYGVKLPASSLHGNEGGTLTMETNLGSVAVPSNMISSDTSDKTAEITIGQGNKENLPENVKDAIGSRPLVQLTLSIDGTQTDWSNPDAPVSVSIPYTPTAEELTNQESIVVWYIDGSGNLVTIPNGHYDPATGNVTFSTTHFSQYAVGYNNIAFSDVPQNAWCSDAVGFIAARGITDGTSNTTFSPDATLKRGQFITMLMKAYGIDPDDDSADNFSDAGDTYYTGYLAAAKRLGISNGVGDNKFAPEKAISRQEMFTLLYNTLKEIDQLPEGDSGKTLSDFTDSGSISSYAMEAMDYLVKNGVVSGNNGCLLPSATTTRAQMAQVIYNLLET
ncbi:MAG: S-layer homology domain-containing protein [Oscillospiraceae bacterium]|nr:S-layer homology domain-containing protein [Oscillospiraceae bacterium]